MATYTLSLDVHCYRPAWTTTEGNKQFATSAYRIYINNILIIERTWVWENNNSIREELIVALEPNIPVTLRLEPVVKIASQAKFSINNFAIDTAQYTATPINEHSFSFVIQ